MATLRSIAWPANAIRNLYGGINNLPPPGQCLIIDASNSLMVPIFALLIIAQGVMVPS
jgi:hypothetical protein